MYRFTVASPSYRQQTVPERGVVTSRDTFLPRDSYAKRGICRRRVSVCLWVCVSATLWYCIKTAKRRITQITPHNSTLTLVFWHQSSLRNSKGITPYRGDKCRWGGLKFVTFDEKRAMFEDGTRYRRIVSLYSRIGSRTCSIEWLCFRRPWVIPNPQTTPIFAFFVAFHIFVVSSLNIYRDLIHIWCTGWR